MIGGCQKVDHSRAIFATTLGDFASASFRLRFTNGNHSRTGFCPATVERYFAGTVFHSRFANLDRSFTLLSFVFGTGHHSGALLRNHLANFVSVFFGFLPTFRHGVSDFFLNQVGNPNPTSDRLHLRLTVVAAIITRVATIAGTTASSAAISKQASQATSIAGTAGVAGNFLGHGFPAAFVATHGTM